MAARFLVIIVAVAAVSTQPIEVAQNNQQNNNFVPGVFISAETLKDLQEKAAKNQSPPITNQGQPITNALSANSQNDDQKGSSYQANSSPQNSPQNQPMNQLNQPAPVQPQVVVAQPVVANPPANQVMVSQPNQAYLVSQPGNNQIYLSQPANQAGQAAFVSQPNQQVVLSNGQIATIVSNGQPIVNNAQPLVNNGQPLIVATNPGSNQITYLQTNPNNIQNPNGVQYAVVPNNNVVSSVPANNGNNYVMVPSTNQVYAVSG